MGTVQSMTAYNRIARGEAFSKNELEGMSPEQLKMIQKAQSAIQRTQCFSRGTHHDIEVLRRVEIPHFELEAKPSLLSLVLNFISNLWTRKSSLVKEVIEQQPFVQQVVTKEKFALEKERTIAAKKAHIRTACYEDPALTSMVDRLKVEQLRDVMGTLQAEKRAAEGAFRAAEETWETANGRFNAGKEARRGAFSALVGDVDARRVQLRAVAGEIGSELQRLGVRRHDRPFLIREHDEALAQIQRRQKELDDQIQRESGYIAFLDVNPEQPDAATNKRKLQVSIVQLAGDMADLDALARRIEEHVENGRGYTQLKAHVEQEKLRVEQADREAEIAWDIEGAGLAVKIDSRRAELAELNRQIAFLQREFIDDPQGHLALEAIRT